MRTMTTRTRRTATQRSWSDRRPSARCFLGLALHPLAPLFHPLTASRHRNSTQHSYELFGLDAKRLVLLGASLRALQRLSAPLTACGVKSLGLFVYTTPSAALEAKRQRFSGQHCALCRTCLLI